MLYLKLLLRPLGSKFATISTLPLGSMAVGDVATFKHPHDERNWVMTTLLLEVLRTRYRTSTTLSSEIVPTFTTPSLHSKIPVAFVETEGVTNESKASRERKPRPCAEAPKLRSRAPPRRISCLRCRIIWVVIASRCPKRSHAR